MGNDICRKQRFVPIDFKPPEKVDISDYYLVPITTDITMEDWIVIKANADMIVQLRGGGSRKEWPYTCTLEEDYKDLAWLEVCASYNQLFCYVLRRKQDSSYAGCVYIYPIDLFYPEKCNEYDVDFSCWITKEEYDKGKYEEIFNKLFDWLSTDWSFKRERIFLRNKEIPKLK